MPKKRTEHSIPKDEIEIEPLNLRLLFADDWKNINIFLNSIFCDCGIEQRKLINYRSYLNKLNDVVLRGKCSGCNSIAARYIETGERKGIEVLANRIRRVLDIQY